MEKPDTGFHRRSVLQATAATGGLLAVGSVDRAAAVETCGATEESTTTSGRLSGDGDGDTYTFEMSLAEPCEVVYSLEAESDDADFDLYVTFDGRTPTRGDSDLRSRGSGPNEEVVVEGSDAVASGEHGVLVRSASGAGAYRLTRSEFGVGGDGTGTGPDGSGSCGNTVERLREDDEIRDIGGQQGYTYEPQLSAPCEIRFSLDTDNDSRDFDLYVTFDGRIPARDDYDRESDTDSADEEIVLKRDTVSVDREYGVLVTTGFAGSEYELTVEEYGTGADPTPTAAIDVDSTEVTTGEAVQFDASGSTPAEGSDRIESFEWTFPGGTFGPVTKTGEYVSHEFDATGSKEVTLTVTSEYGVEDTATTTIDVQSDSGGDGDFW